MFKKFVLPPLLSALALASCSKKESADPTPTAPLAHADLRICTELPTDSTVRGKGNAAGWTAMFWRGGEAIRVKFLNGDPTLQNRVRNAANEWMQYANVRFTYVGASDPADIKIGFKWNNDSGSWSRFGKDCRGVAQNAPSMNYGWFDASTTDEDIRATTLHEFGHALGLIHEHQSPAANISWNRPAVYDYYARTNGWSTQKVDQQVFAKYSASQTNYTAFDPASIMEYAIPAELTTDGFSVGWNTVLSNTDKSFIGGTYPIPAYKNALYEGEQLLQGQSIRSANGQLQLILQTDGNLVLYRGSVPLWNSNTWGRPYITRCILQSDGNLVLYDNNGTPYWDSRTSNRPGAYLILQDDANLVVYQGGGAAWASNTSGR